jgi:hypothetical protein
LSRRRDRGLAKERTGMLVKTRRHRLLEFRQKARAAMSHPDLPQHARDLYKSAYDRADAALGIQDEGPSLTPGPRLRYPRDAPTLGERNSMARSQTVADGSVLAFKCPKCGKMTDQPVSWFVDKDILPCGGCGHGINLKTAEARRRIEETLRQVARVQAALTEAGNRS